MLFSLMAGGIAWLATGRFLAGIGVFYLAYGIYRYASTSLKYNGGKFNGWFFVSNVFLWLPLMIVSIFAGTGFALYAHRQSKKERND